MIDQFETNYGTMFLPDTDNGQYWWLKTTGASPEDEMIELICDLLRERPIGTAIDCGANFGCWSLPLSKVATSVVAFEPQRCVFDLLDRTIRANPKIENIIRWNLALGPERSKIAVPDLRLDDTTNFGGVSLGVPHSEHPDAPTYEIQVVPLDEMIESMSGIRHVSFIKADVEGAELGLFQGAVRTIAKYRPIIIAEADHPLTDTFALGNFIESLGYNVELVQDNNFIGMPL